MVWYIPTTWFENLGSGVKRVSLYRSHEIENQQLRMSCRVRLPDGSVVVEEDYLRDHHYTIAKARGTERHDTIEILRSRIRAKHRM